MRNDPQSEYDMLLRQLNDLQYYLKNLRSGPFFNNIREQEESSKVEEKRLLEKEIDIRIRLEELRRGRLDLNRLYPASGTRLDELYPTMPAPGVLLRFDHKNVESEGRWCHPAKNGETGYRNLATGIDRSYDNMTWTLMSPFVMVHPEAMAMLLPCEPAFIGDSWGRNCTAFVRIVINSVRRNSEIVWAPITDLVLV